MYIVTGGAGFVGSNLVHEMNRQGIKEILVVDNLSNGRKIHNLQGAQFVDFMDKRDFRKAIRERALGLPRVHAVFHQGACTNTLEDDGVYMMDNNFAYSKDVLGYAIEMEAPFVYASSAAVYGLAGPGRFAPTPENERPLNVYAFSKLAFDRYVRYECGQRRVPMTVVGLRYFNVFGPREGHKGPMASVVHQFIKQIRDTGTIRLFKGSGGYQDGDQRRDFVYVDDIAKVNLFFAQIGPYTPSPGTTRRTSQGIVNVGSGTSRTFNDVAAILMSVYRPAKVEYIPFPRELEGRYQHFTEADLTSLRELGCDVPFTSLETAIPQALASCHRADATTVPPVVSGPSRHPQRET